MCRRGQWCNINLMKNLININWMKNLKKHQPDEKPEKSGEKNPQLPPFQMTRPPLGGL
jgi:hypothetical protein